MGNAAKKARIRPIGRSVASVKSVAASVFTLRFWKILLVLAAPFFWVCAGYLERIEKMGPGWAEFADVSFSALICGYLVFVFVLRNSDI